jgi:hypothetical protein
MTNQICFALEMINLAFFLIPITIWEIQSDPSDRPSPNADAGRPIEHDEASDNTQGESRGEFDKWRSELYQQQ